MRNFLKLVLRNAHVVAGYAVGGLSWESALEVKLDRGGVVALAFLNFSGLGFLTCLEEPLEVIVLELVHVLVLELLCDLD